MWIELRKKTPRHKDLIICKNKKGAVIPAIYYDNVGFKGFYEFTTYFQYPFSATDTYSEVKYERIKSITQWMLMPI